jgi:hypothetical protein
MEARTHPDVSVQPLSSDVRFTPESGHSLERQACPLWAISGLLHRSKERAYSITSSARSRIDVGTEPILTV